MSFSSSRHTGGRELAHNFSTWPKSPRAKAALEFLHLEVNHGNRANELYRRRGFVDHNRYLMTKPLNPGA